MAEPEATSALTPRGQYVTIHSRIRGVAQLARAPALGAGRREFESRHSDQIRYHRLIQCVSYGIFFIHRNVHMSRVFGRPCSFPVKLLPYMPVLMTFQGSTFFSLHIIGFDVLETKNLCIGL